MFDSLDPGVVSALVIASATLGAAAIAAWASLRTNRKIKTNHNMNIGEHVELQGDKLDELIRWAMFHQASDNEVRRALGLSDASYPLTPPELRKA